MHLVQPKWVPGPLDCQVLCSEPCTDQLTALFCAVDFKSGGFFPPYFIGGCTHFSRPLISLALYSSSCDLEEAREETQEGLLLRTTLLL